MTDTNDLNSYSWPASQLHNAMAVLAKKVGLLDYNPNMLTLSGYEGPADDSIIEQWMAVTTKQNTKCVGSAGIITYAPMNG